MRTSRAPAASNTIPRPGTDALACPGCGAAVPIAAEQLVERALAVCPRCGAQAGLTREFDERTGRSHWALVEVADEPDEDRSR